MGSHGERLNVVRVISMTIVIVWACSGSCCMWSAKDPCSNVTKNRPITREDVFERILCLASKENSVRTNAEVWLEHNDKISIPFLEEFASGKGSSAIVSQAILGKGVSSEIDNEVDLVSRVNELIWKVKKPTAIQNREIDELVFRAEQLDIEGDPTGQYHSLWIEFRELIDNHLMTDRLFEYLTQGVFSEDEHSVIARLSTQFVGSLPKYRYEPWITKHLCGDNAGKIVRILERIQRHNDLSWLPLSCLLALLHHQDAQVRGLAVRCLLRTGSNEALSIAGALHSDPDPFVVGGALLASSKYFGDKSLEILQSAYGRFKYDYGVVECIMKSLDNLSEPKKIVILKEIMKNKDEYFRRQVIGKAEYLTSVNRNQLLMWFATHDESKLNRLKALEILILHDVVTETEYANALKVAEEGMSWQTYASLALSLGLNSNRTVVRYLRDLLRYYEPAKSRDNLHIWCNLDQLRFSAFSVLSQMSNVERPDIDTRESAVRFLREFDNWWERNHQRFPDREPLSDVPSDILSVEYREANQD